MGLSVLQQVQHQITVIKPNSGPRRASEFIVVVIIIIIRNTRKHICRRWKRKVVILRQCQQLGYVAIIGRMGDKWRNISKKP
jgi:hypothetical protein